MVEVMKITSFKRPQAHTATLSAAHPVAGHHRPTPPPETPGPSWESLGQSLVGSLLISPGSWCTRLCLCLQESVSPGLCRVWRLYGELMATSSKSAYAIPRSTTRRAPALQQSTADLGPTGDAQTQFCLSLCGVCGSW